MSKLKRILRNATIYSLMLSIVPSFNCNNSFETKEKIEFKKSENTSPFNNNQENLHYYQKTITNSEDKHTNALKSVEGTGDFYPQTFNQFVKDLYELAQTKREDGYIHILGEGTMDIGYYLGNNPLTVIMDTKLAYVSTIGKNIAFIAHFHPLENNVPSPYDFKSVNNKLNYFKSVNKVINKTRKNKTNCHLINLVVDKTGNLYFFNTKKFTQDEKYIINHATLVNTIKTNPEYYHKIKEKWGRKEGVKEENNNNKEKTKEEKKEEFETKYTKKEQKYIQNYTKYLNKVKSGLSQTKKEEELNKFIEKSKENGFYIIHKKIGF